ncbi:orexin/Hypocretin receptor type 1 [Tribolium castaneum]|uniref:orexin/Hypocretin receptor type 1 n=1 Tax=Tribolium castaneum TaxID=7070 RepID=UPI0001757DF4|nr:PREDICTED: orexin receptor type 1 [Tribolium castaneum]|eukprot:XP_967232.2 PREDICTED: orexin receptor type 1 [Tribolium castaneum]
MDADNYTQNVQNDVPPEVWEIIHEFLLGQANPKLDLRKPHLRPSVASSYPFILFMYSLLIVTGVALNVSVFIHIVRNKLQNDVTCSFVLNNVISDIVKCVVVLPITLYVLLINNWILGELLCSFLPMLQDIPMHTTTLTFLLMAWDRLRFIRHPTKARFPAFVCIIGTWLASVCLVLPYPIYIIYIDLGKYVPSLDGVGICLVNLADDMQEYMRGIFLIMYAAPLATISYLYVRVSRELQTQQSSLTVIKFETRREGRSRTDSHSTTTDFRSSRGDYDRSSQYSRSSYRDHENGRTRYENEEPDLDVAKEKRTQKYLVPMVTLYAIYLCPLMILRLARLVLPETYENNKNFDISYTMFVWVAFAPTCSTPVLYIVWQMNRSSKERLLGYFRFSNRKLRQSCETVITAAGTPAVPRAKCGQTESIVHQVDDGHSDNNSFQHDFPSS